VWTGAAVGIEEAYGGSSKPFSEKEWSNKRRHFTVVSGVDIEHIEGVIGRTDISAKRREIGIQESKRIVSMTARLISWKGHDDLLEAFVSLPKDTELVLIGEGPRRKTLSEKADSLGITKRVHFIGDRTDVFELMAISDVYVQTYSRNKDGSIWKGPNTSQMIAAASGVPAVSTNVPLIELFMTDGIHGRLAKINDSKDLAQKINYLLEHKEDAKKLARNAKEMVREKYSLDAMVGSYEKIYRKLITS